MFYFMAKENRRKVSIDIVGAKLFAVAFMVVAAIALLGSTASFASCTAKDDNAASQYEQTTFIPQAPDYNDATMWVTSIAAILGFTASVWRRTSMSGPRSGGSCTSQPSPVFRNVKDRRDRFIDLFPKDENKETEVSALI